jgi:ABC-type nitrate/sulfonate/bicarbonate transport system ATPase subunit
MLLDEPFGALDALTRQEMQQWLLGIWEEDRKTIFFVTHDVEEALLMSDRVYVMSGRPSRIELCLDIELGRPRDPVRAAVDPELAELKLRLLEPLRRGAAAAAGGA